MEKLRILDDKGKDINKIVDREIVHELGLWHREISVWVFNNNGDVLIQRRSGSKKMSPNKLAICAGHVEASNTSLTSAKNELFEEIGLDVDENDIAYLTTEKKEKIFGVKSINRIFNDVYYVISNKNINEFKIQEEELSEVMWINYFDLKNRILNNDDEIVIKVDNEEEMNTFGHLDKIYCKITHK